MFKKTMTIGLTLVFGLGLTGCGSPSHNKNSSMSGMSNMDMGNMNKTQQSSPLKKAFNDELDGFTKIQEDVQKKDFNDATNLANKLHDEFHAAILPPLKAKKGATYAENIHGKYDELQDAIASKDVAKMNQLIKTNQDNLHLVAHILNVNLNS